MTDKVSCDLCPHACKLHEGQTGLCRARKAQGGRVVAQNYGRVTSLALDPIEKKPLARFRPGSLVLSVGSYGCNLSCPFCQNASIAAAGENDVSWRQMSPCELVEEAVSFQKAGCVGLAFTYNEPVVGFEFVYDTARLSHDAGLVNVLVSNGMLNERPLVKLGRYLDAVNIDLKGFSQDFYDRCCGDYETVRATISYLALLPTCHVEVTTLVIPGLNDDEKDVEQAAAWLASLDPGIVYHLTRFFPRHRMRDGDPTSVSTLLKLKDAALRHLRYVQVGNV